MYDQLKAQSSNVTINSAMPTPNRQVEGALDSLNYSLDALQDTVNDLIRRLEPVTGGCPESDTGESPSALLVPVAARIHYSGSRVNDLHQRLACALNALEI